MGTADFSTSSTENAVGPHIVITTDVSGKAGTGHWVHKQTLADQLAKSGSKLRFIPRLHDPDTLPPKSHHTVLWLNPFIQTKGARSFPTRIYRKIMMSVPA